MYLNNKNMNLELLEKFKTLTIIALVSDDDLMDRLVLKGGNAINLIHKLNKRASIDIDFSIADDFSKEERNDIENRIKALLENTFKENGYTIFDFKFKEKPNNINSAIKEFWGGYKIEFKILENEKYNSLSDIDSRRRQAIVIRKNNSTIYSVEISKYEFVKPKKDFELEAYTVFAYTPEMIICEKIRSIFQQLPDYSRIVGSNSQASRARDFFDIYTLVKHYNFNINEEINIELIKKMFDAKKVPLDYLSRIEELKEFHKSSHQEVVSTVETGIDVEDFEVYFDFVKDLCEKANAEFIKND